MSAIVLLVVVTLACGTRMVLVGAVNYGSVPYNVYGNTVPVQRNYLQSPIQYGGQRSYATPMRRASYSTAQQRRTYALLQPRAYAPVQLKNYEQAQPRVTYPVVQPRTYTQPVLASRTYVQRSPWLPTKFKPPVAYYALARRPITNALVQQPIRNIVVQRPISRTVTNAQWYRNAGTSERYPQNYIVAQTPPVPMRFAAYGRNHIPRTPLPKSYPRNSVVTTNQARKSPAVISKNFNIKKNNIALTKDSMPQVLQRDQVTRNHVYGITLPNKFVVNEHVPIHPTKARFDPSTNGGKKLSSFLKNVKSLQDAFEDNNMKQGLIFYNDDITNKTRHRPTNFAPPTRKLGSQGAPGGSRVTFMNENAKSSSVSNKATAGDQSANERVKIEKSIGKTLGNLSRVQGNVSNVSSAIKSKEGANVQEEQSLGTKYQNETSEATSLPQSIVGSAKASNFENPKVDLRLLKEKVLHSNNSQFLKRVLQVLRKYTKLMKSNMVEKKRNKTTERGAVGKTVLNASSTTNIQDKMQSVKNASNFRNGDVIFKNFSTGKAAEEYTSGLGNNSQKVAETFKNFGNAKADEEYKSWTENFETKNKSRIEENSTGLVNPLNLTSTAVRIFDLLNIASKHNSKNSVHKENSETATPVQTNSTTKKPGLKKSDWGSSDTSIKSFQDSKSQNSHPKSQKSISKNFTDTKDENASKKEKIETEYNVGRPIFNLQKLRYGLERGNTID